MTAFLVNTFIFSIVISQASFACENSSDKIIGTWQFYKYIFDGSEHSPPNPNLNLYFQFFATGTNRLWWNRKNEVGFCERIGHYTYANCTLNDEVVWVNPKNNIDCSQDPDMQVGKITYSRLEIVDGELYLYLSLKGESLIYVWRKESEKLFPLAHF